MTSMASEHPAVPGIEVDWFDPAKLPISDQLTQPVSQQLNNEVNRSRDVLAHGRYQLTGYREGHTYPTQNF